MRAPKQNNLRPQLFIPPAILLSIAILLILLAPAEATIGDGIRIVAIHVSLIWTGMLGLVLTGIMGLVIVAWPDERLLSWMESTARVSLVVYALGVGTSLIAEIINWGGIAWNEPRTAANLNLLALAIIIQVIVSWLHRPRLQGVLHLAVAGAILWTTVTTELQLHPSGAVSSSPSGNIRFTFYALTLCCLLFSAWVICFIQTRRSDPAVVAGHTS
jgi:hypothetical protein